ncbi:MAG: hypothetical protein IJ489_02805 [Clostridia bacterium]|nr:hypothetical protein [Clostridia bacterium]
MGVYYHVKEKLTVRNTEICEEMVLVMKHQLSLLGFLMLNDDASIENLTLNADGKEYHFEGYEITPKFHTILRTIENAQEFTWEADYDYTWRLRYDDMNVSPFAVYDAVKNLLAEDPGAAKYFFYSMYNGADGNEGITTTGGIQP